MLVSQETSLLDTPRTVFLVNKPGRSSSKAETNLTKPRQNRTSDYSCFIHMGKTVIPSLEDRPLTYKPNLVSLPPTTTFLLTVQPLVLISCFSSSTILSYIYLSLFYIILFIYLAMLGLHCCVSFSVIVQSGATL